MEELLNADGWRVTKETLMLPDGRAKSEIRVHRPDTVHIIAFKTPQTILMLHEFRPFYGTHAWMLPGGKADKEFDLLETAQRELQEEAGFRAKHMKRLWTGNYSDALSSTSHVFHATDLEESRLPQDIDEDIEVHEMSVADALEHLLSGERVHLASAYALLRFEREREMI